MTVEDLGYYYDFASARIAGVSESHRREFHVERIVLSAEAERCFWCRRSLDVGAEYYRLNGVTTCSDCFRRRRLRQDYGARKVYSTVPVRLPRLRRGKGF